MLSLTTKTRCHFFKYNNVIGRNLSPFLCECEALASLRNAHLGSFLDTEDIKNRSLGAIWNFSTGTGLP